MTTALVVVVWTVIVLGSLAWLVSGAAIAILVCKSIRRGDRQAGITQEKHDADQAAWLYRDRPGQPR